MSQDYEPPQPNRLQQETERNISIWTDLGLFSLALYVLLGWTRVILWFVKEYKLGIPILIFTIVAVVNFCTYSVNRDYREYIREKGKQERAGR